MANSVRTRDGVTTMVHKHRPHLVDDNGVHRLFVRAHDAPLEWRGPEQSGKSRNQVRVRYDRSPGLLVYNADHVTASKDAAPLPRPHQGSQT